MKNSLQYPILKSNLRELGRAGLGCTIILAILIAAAAACHFLPV